MTTSAHSAMHRAVVSPKAPERKVISTDMYSPRTITLGNQSESILRGMVAADGLYLPQQRHQQQQPRFTQAPMLPAMLASSPTRPIRITRRKPLELQPRYATQLEGEDALSASPTELKLMYDEATWRMYHLIQTARMEKQAAKAATIGGPQHHPQWPSVTSHTNDEGKYIYDDSFFAPPASMMPAVVSPEEDYVEETEHDDCVFELDDL